MRVDRCYLHIGAEKTGSTSLQATLGLNRPVLERSGFLFPRCAGLTNQVRLAIYAANDDAISEIHRFEGVMSSKEVPSFRERFRYDLEKEVRDSKQIHTVIFSNEHLQSRLHDPTEILRLKELIDGIAVATTVILYLRPQVSMATSFYSTYLKAGGTRAHVLPTSGDWDWKFFKVYFDFLGLYDRWAAVFGPESISVKLLDSLPSGNVVDDVLDSIGFPDPDDLIRPKRLNDSIDHRGQELLRRMNQGLPLSSAEGFNLGRDRLDRAFEWFFAGKGRLPGRGEVQRFLAEFRDSNEQLEKRLASSGVKFEDDPLTHYPITSDPPFLDSGWLVEATTKLWRFGRAHALCLDARLLIRDDLDATERLLTQIESVAPNLPDTAYLRALVAQGRNDLAAARDLASQAARGDPLHPEYISFLEAVSSACADRREAGVSEPDPPPLPDAPLSIEQSAQHDAEQT